MSPKAQYGIADLVQLTGISRRTIRYYVQRGLVPPPQGAGRGHYYEAEHLERLQHIRDLQNRGKTLDDIRALINGSLGLDNAPLPEIDVVTRIRIRDGIELFISPGAVRPTPSEVRALAAAAARIFTEKPG